MNVDVDVGLSLVVAIALVAALAALLLGQRELADVLFAAGLVALVVRIVRLELEYARRRRER